MGSMLDFTPPAFARALKCAKGSEQRAFVESAIRRETRSYAQTLRGRAKQFGGKYQSAFANLLERLRASGVSYQRTPGPRGGEYSATYRILPN